MLFICTHGLNSTENPFFCVIFTRWTMRGVAVFNDIHKIWLFAYCAFWAKIYFFTCTPIINHHMRNASF